VTQADKTLDEDEAEQKLNELLKYKEHMLNGKTTQLPAWAKRAQQHLSKMNYRVSLHSICVNKATIGTG